MQATPFNASAWNLLLGCNLDWLGMMGIGVQEYMDCHWLPNLALNAILSSHLYDLQSADEALVPVYYLKLDWDKGEAFFAAAPLLKELGGGIFSMVEILTVWPDF